MFVRIKCVITCNYTTERTIKLNHTKPHMSNKALLFGWRGNHKDTTKTTYITRVFADHDDVMFMRWWFTKYKYTSETRLARIQSTAHISP